MTALSIVSIAASSAGALAVGGRVGDEDRLRGEDVADLAQAVHDERRAGRHEVDDRLGEPESRRDLDRARDRDDLDRRCRRSAKNRRAVFGWAVATRRPARSVDGLVRRVVRDRGGEAAAAVAERRGRGAARRRSRLRRSTPVIAEVGDAVADELDDVVRAHEQDVEVVVLDARDEAPVVLLEDEPGVVEQAQRRLDEAALVRDRRGAGGALIGRPRRGRGRCRPATRRRACRASRGSRPRRG